MELFDLQEDFIIDQDDGLRKLLIWFYNLVMQSEAKSSITLSPRTVIGTYSSTLGSPINFFKRRSTSLGLTSLERDLKEKKKILESTANLIIALEQTQDSGLHSVALFLGDSY